MGHLVNPISFRLGTTQTWKSQWFVSGNLNYALLLKDDFLLYNYLESFFKYSKIFKRDNSVVTFIKYIITKRNNNGEPLPRKRNLLFLKYKFSHLRSFQRKRFRVKRYALSQLINKLSIVFSHVTISRIASTISLSLYLYDGALEKKMSRRTFRRAQSRRYAQKKKRIASGRWKKKFEKIKNRSKKRSLKYYVYLKTRRNLFLEKLLLFKLKRFGLLFLKNCPFKKKHFKQNIRLFKVLWFFFLLNFSNLAKSYRLFLIRILLHLSIFIKKGLNLFLRYLTKKQFLSNFIRKKLKRKLYKPVLRILYRKNSYLRYIDSDYIYVPERKNYFELIRPFTAQKKIGRLGRFKRHIRRNFRHNSFYSRIKRAWYRRNFYRFKRAAKNRRKKFKPILLSYYKRKGTILSSKKYSKLKRIYLKIKKTYYKLTLFSLYLLKIIGSSNYVRRIIYKYRYKIWYYVTRTLYENVKSLMQSNNNMIFNNVLFTYYGLNNSNITAQMLANYMSVKLYQKHTIFEILRPVTRDLTFNKGLGGFKIVCAGRLTKKQRAGLVIQRTKTVSLNNLDTFVDYGTSITRLRHGVCGIKIWIDRNKKYKPYTYLFKFYFSNVIKE